MQQTEDQSKKHEYTAVALNVLQADVKAALAKLPLDPPPHMTERVPNSFHGPSVYETGVAGLFYSGLLPGLFHQFH